MNIDKQISDYRKSAAEYRAKGDIHAAEFLEGRIHSMEAAKAYEAHRAA